MRNHLHQIDGHHIQFHIHCRMCFDCCFCDFFSFLLLLLSFYSFSFQISGILLILFGLWTLLYKQDYVALSTSSLYQIATFILIFAGVLIIITGVIGILSAWFESKRFLIFVSCNPILFISILKFQHFIFFIIFLVYNFAHFGICGRNGIGHFGICVQSQSKFFTSLLSTFKKNFFF